MGRLEALQIYEVLVLHYDKLKYIRRIWGVFWPTEFRYNAVFIFFSRRAEKAKYLTKSSEVMRNFAGEKKKHSSTRAE